MIKKRQIVNSGSFAINLKEMEPYRSSNRRNMHLSMCHFDYIFAESINEAYKL